MAKGTEGSFFALFCLEEVDTSVSFTTISD